jgi:putative acyl-CoA dehydrogenase
MAMTEKQGGSDVRANRTRADPVDWGGPGGLYRITGHKWFCSAPMSDVFLVLAQAPGGLSCFLLPRWLPDGNRTAFHLLVRSGHPAVADAFCASRLAGDWGRAFGTLPRGIDVPAILERAHPKTV